MVTWEELLLLSGLLVAIADFVFNVCKHIFKTKKEITALSSSIREAVISSLTEG